MKNFNSLYLTIVFILIMTAKSIYSQNPDWETYSLGNTGLMDNYIHTIIVDNFNNIWIANDKGLVKYDGENWIKYDPGLTNIYFTTMTIDSSDDLWFGTDNGLAKFDGRNWTTYKSNLKGLNVTSVKIDHLGNKWISTTGVLGYDGQGIIKFDGSSWTNYNKNNSALTSNDINCIAIDRLDNLWIGTWKNGLVKFDGITWTAYDSTNSGLPNDIIESIAVDSSNNVWIGTYSSGVVKFDGKNWTIYNRSNSIIQNTPIESISTDPRGNLWFGVWWGQYKASFINGSIVKYDGQSWTSYNASNSNMSPSGASTIAFDKAGIAWIGTVDGVYLFDGKNWMNYSTYNTGLPSYNGFSLTIDSMGNKWIGTKPFSNGINYVGGGLTKFDGKKWTVYNTTNSGMPSNTITSLAVEDSGIIWVGTDNGLIKFDGQNWITFDTSNSKIPSNNIFSIAIDNNNIIWIGTDNGLGKFDGNNWYNYNSNNSSLPDNYVESITIDKYGNKWIGTEWDGIAKFNGTIWEVYNSKNSNFPNGNIYGTIAISNSGNIWVATDAGLARFNGSNWSVYNTNNSGIPSNNVLSIAIDDANNKWIGTSSYWNGSNYIGGGMVKYDGTNWTVYNSSNSSLPANQVVTIVIDKSGNKWMGVKDQNSYLKGSIAVFNEGGIISSIKSSYENIQQGYLLYQNYPNPFNPTTVIDYKIPRSGLVTLKIYDILGREVATLVDDEKPAGNYKVSFDGSRLSSGIYFYRIQAGDYVSVKKMILMK